MKILNQNMTIRDYCDALDRGDIVINKDYQRSDQVWPPMAKSYLVETMILDYPVPKLFLHQTVDLRTRRPIKQVVDGQQRTRAILEFKNDQLVLSRKLETERLRGARFSELDDDEKELFLNYGLSIDLFTAAPVDEVIEVFRRMNSYTVPLNPEEKRHAQFQGVFKWFINSEATRLQPIFMRFGVFSQKQIVRMADAKLLTEIVHANINGITTTNAKALDTLYKNRDQEFPEEAVIKGDLESASELMIQWPDLNDGPLAKPYQIYCLILAIAHVQREIEALAQLFPSPRTQINAVDVLPALSRLAAAVDGDELDGPFADFIRASTDRTNVRSQRESRFVWFCRALTDEFNA
jgi:hypothetical protein